MSTYAPTLYLGLGGSGTYVVRALRCLFADPLGGISEPLAFGAIDLDYSNEPGQFPILPAGEFLYLRPAGIAECVQSLTSGVLDARGGTSEPVFRVVRSWYPDLDGKSIRYPQAEATGARQWRPLGRLGFVLNDREIRQFISTLMVELDQRSGKAAQGELRTVYLVASLAGGTGSGMLLDVAAVLRRVRPEVSLRMVLLLPQFFELIDFGAKMVANTYAALWEIANFKNQHRRFVAEYLRIEQHDVGHAEALAHRVYIVGPYVGDRRPFRNVMSAYGYLAEQLRVLCAKTLRFDQSRYSVNASADLGVSLDDPASRDCFCTFGSAGLQLINVEILAALIARGLAHEVTANKNGLFDVLTPGDGSQEIERVVRFIKEAVATDRSNAALSRRAVSELLKAKVADLNPANDWTQDELKKLTDALQVFCGEKGADLPAPIILARSAFQTKLDLELDQVKAQIGFHPHRLRKVLSRLIELAAPGPAPVGSVAVTGIADFHEWLSGRRLKNWILSLPLLRAVRLARLQEHVLDALEARFAEPDPVHAHEKRSRGAVLYEYALRAAAVERLRQELDLIETDLSASKSLMEEVERETSRVVDGDASADEHAIFRVSSTNVPEILERVIGVHPGDEATDYVRKQAARQDITQAFHSALNDTRLGRDSARALVDKLKEALERGVKFEQDPGQPPAKFLSPFPTHGDETISKMILSCVTPVFRTGRVESSVRARTARVVIPEGVANRKRIVETFQRFCDGLVGAVAQEIPPDPGESRILILVEDLFHPAEEIEQVYDYYNDYHDRRRHPRPELFHIDRRLPRDLPPLLLRSSEGRVECGNPGCDEDLRSVPRDRVLCPHCHRPIRNRCGNLGCALDDLSLHPDLPEIVQSGFCPGCRRQLRTYWWLCNWHPQRVPTTKQHCPDCVREGRPKAKIGRRPDVESFYVCPGCTARGSKDPFVATGVVALACLLGVNGQDSISIVGILEATLPDGKHCPRCGSLLVPVCLLKQTEYLHRATMNEFWHCYGDHPNYGFARCYSCDFPLRPEDEGCPRCLTLLDDCWLCTPYHRLRIPRADRTAPCPNCRLPRRKDSLSDACHQQSCAQRFCPNIFQCPAGSRFETLLFPGDQQHCPFCNTLLMEALTRRDHVSACAFCRRLFPGLLDVKQELATEGHCCLCGQTFAGSSWLQRARPGSFNVALAIARSLQQHLDDPTAFRALLKALSSDDRTQLDRHLAEFVERIVSPEICSIVLGRVERLLALFRQQFGNQRTKPADCWDSQPVSQDAAPPLSQPTVAHGADEDTPVDALLDPDYIIRLGDDPVAIEAWVGALLARAVSHERFRAALGAVSAKKDLDDLTRKRFENLREAATTLFEEQTDSD